MVRLNRDRQSKADVGKNLLLNERSVIARDGNTSVDGQLTTKGVHGKRVGNGYDLG